MVLRRVGAKKMEVGALYNGRRKILAIQKE